jgi:hypothetical protein
MDRRGYIFFSLMLFFLAMSMTIIYYLVTANFFTRSNLFWIGGLAGVSVCAFLISTTLLLYLFITRAVSTKKFKLAVLLLILSALSFAIIYFTGWYSRGSDVWWYGAIAGFLSCLSFAFLVLAFHTGYKLLSYHSKK